MSKLCPKYQYFVGAPLLSSTALILLGMEFTRAAQVVAGILFHSSIMTSQSCWMLDTWCFSTFRLRMPHMCSIGFRSGDILGHSITFTFSSKAVVILAVCLGWLLCWKTVSEGRASSSASECIIHSIIKTYIMQVKDTLLCTLISPQRCEQTLSHSCNRFCSTSETSKSYLIFTCYLSVSAFHGLKKKKNIISSQGASFTIEYQCS